MSLFNGFYISSLTFYLGLKIENLGSLEGTSLVNINKLNVVCLACIPTISVFALSVFAFFPAL